MKKIICIFVSIVILMGCGKVVIDPDYFKPSTGTGTIALTIKNDTDSFMPIADFGVHDFGDLQKGQKINKNFEINIVSDSSDFEVTVSMVSDFWGMSHTVEGNKINIAVTNKVSKVGSFLGTIEILVNKELFSIGVVARQSDTIAPPSGVLFPEKLTLVDGVKDFPVVIGLQNYLGANGHGWVYSGGAEFTVNKLINIPYMNIGKAVASYDLQRDTGSGYYVVALRSNKAISANTSQKFILRNRDSNDVNLKEISVDLGAIDENWTEYGILVTLENIRLYKTSALAPRKLIATRAITVADSSSLPINVMDFAVNNSANIASNIYIEKIAYYLADFTVENTPPVESVTLNKSTVSLVVGGTETLTATILPDTALQTVVWNSSDETKATVTDSGLVTVLATGSVTITGRAGRVEDSCEITISARPSAPDSTLRGGTTYTLVKAFDFNEIDGDFVYTNNESVTLTGGVVKVASSGERQFSFTFNNLGSYECIQIRMKYDYNTNPYFSSNNAHYSFARVDGSSMSIRSMNSAWSGDTIATSWTSTSDWNTFTIINNGTSAPTYYFNDSSLGVSGSNYSTGFTGAVGLTIGELNSGTLGNHEIEYVAFYN